MTSIELRHIGKRFGSTVALEDVNLQIAPGELLFLLGPSGCGKSTLLRIIAGLLEPSGGSILFDGSDVTGLGTQQRNAVMCFQNYALWPHMTVRQNVGFGLSVRGGGADGQSARVGEALRLVQLEAYADRKPNALSGGQQQRAALARALVVAPKCLLLDEPLSNLDAKLRLEMRSEIRRICKSAGYTTIYVTHDQKEALSIADRIVLLQDGRIVQIGSPAELYYRPKNAFVADFVGQTNLLNGTIEEIHSDGVSVRTELGTIKTAGNAGKDRRDVIVSIRPERIRILSGGAARSPAANHLAGKVIETIFLGEVSEHWVEIDGHRLKASRSGPMLETLGEVVLEIDAGDCVVLPE
jgi:iron(III) transport system ATP-binding protein